MNYKEFLQKKAIVSLPTGLEPGSLNPILFDHQTDMIKWGVRRGRAAVFADCGLGKSFIQLEWCNEITRQTNKPTLIKSNTKISQKAVPKKAVTQKKKVAA